MATKLSKAYELTDAEVHLTAGLVSLPAESPVPRLFLHRPIVRLLYPRFIRVPAKKFMNSHVSIFDSIK